jgi:hypothetical protein
MQGLSADKRQGLTDIHKGFQLGTFFDAKCAFVVSIHQLLQPAISGSR